MSDFLDDVRHSARMLWRTPGFTIVALLTLALGIGANTAVFSLLNAALFRRANAADPERLVWLVGTRDGESRFRYLAWPEYQAHRAQDSAFSGLATYNTIAVALGSGGEPARVSGQMVTGNYFDVIGLPMQLGRGFLPSEDSVPGAAPVVVLGDGLWRRRFAADSAIVGSRITINGASFLVVGVAPRGFAGIGLGETPELFVPMAMIATAWPGNAGILEARGAGWLYAIGRLRPGATIEGARAQAMVVGTRLAGEWPEPMKGTSASVQPIRGGLDPNNRAEGVPIFALLMAVPGMVLLIACANAANLLLARAAARRREIGVRLAIGATRWRLVRMLATESLMLGAAASVIAMLFAVWLTSIIGAIGDIPSYITDVITPDGRVLAFTLVLGAATGLVFGLVPAWGATRADVVPRLKEDGLSGRGAGRSRLRSAFVVAQVSVSLVLLVVAGLFLRTLSKAAVVDAGFEPKGGLAVDFDLPTQGYSVARQEQFYRDLLERTRGLPGVTAVALARELPLSSRAWFSQVMKEGEDQGGNRRAGGGHQTGITVVTPGFFDAFGSPLVAGRDFTPRDDSGATKVAIINERLAAQLWPGESPLGKRIKFTGERDPLLEVVGVARDGKYHDLTEDPSAYLYLPRAQAAYDGSDVSLVVRTAGNPAPLLPTVRAILHQMDPNLPVYELRTLEEHVRLRLDKERGVSALLGSFGALALLLATLGLYGVMAYTVAQRTKEIGIRVALGAARPQLLRMVVGEGVKLAGIGIATGLVLAAVLTQVIRKFLFGVTPTDAATFVAVAALMTGVAALASLVPARRAAAVDPIVSLRAE